MTISDEYRRAMREHHVQRLQEGFKWGATGMRYTGELVKNTLRKHPEVKTVLDYGAGQGTLGRGIVEKFDVEWTDYDPGVPAIDTLPEGVFDLVVSSDCLEHVEPPLIRETVREIGDKARLYILFDIPNEGTGGTLQTGPYKGHDEHLIIEGSSWWRELCNDVLRDFVLDQFSDKAVMLKGRPRPRTRMLWRRHGSW